MRDGEAIRMWLVGALLGWLYAYCFRAAGQEFRC